MMLAMSGLEMAYEMEGEGIPLLFIHQGATDRRLWEHQRSSFFQGYRLITVDVMGHGEGAWSPQACSLDRAAGHIQELLAHLRTGPAFIIGVSMERPLR
jgi:pimeloyl-ACP methyl ester carboxylesterase